MSLTRRTFLINTTLAYCSASLLLNGGGKVITSLFNRLGETIAEKLKRAAELRRATTAAKSASLMSTPSAENLQAAKSLYQEIIQIKYDEIRAYDGLRKILLFSKNKGMEVLNLYKEPYSTHSGNKDFKERTAKEYVRIALGNKKLVSELNTTQHQLLVTANTYFKELSANDPAAVQYNAQFKTTSIMLANEAGYLDARDNPKLKAKKREDRQAYQHRFDKLSSGEVHEKLAKLLAKPLRPNRPHHIRDVYKIYISKLIAEGKPNEAVKALEELYMYDVNDSHALFLARKYCIKYSAFDALERIDRDNAKHKDTLWSKLALADTILKRFSIEKVGDLNEVRFILDDAAKYKASFTESFEIKYRRIKLLMAAGQLQEANKELIRLAKKIKGITSAHWVDKFNRLCCSFYLANNEEAKQLMVIDIALKQNETKPADELMIEIHGVNKHRVVENPIHNKVLANYRNQLTD